MPEIDKGDEITKYIAINMLKLESQSQNSQFLFLIDPVPDERWE
jgi:hypothetical protein